MGNEQSRQCPKARHVKEWLRCLNDEMSENIADAILMNFETWATTAGVNKIDFTYGVLYGTQKQSNKKDWHILRNIKEKLTRGTLEVSPFGRLGLPLQERRHNGHCNDSNRSRSLELHRITADDVYGNAVRSHPGLHQA